METLKIKVEINEEIQQNRKELFLELKADPRVTMFLKDNNLDQTFLMNNIQKFKDWLTGLDECEVCVGLHACVKEVNGHYFELYYDGILHKILTACRFQQAKNEKNHYLNNYLEREFPDDLIDINLSSIDYKNESLQYLEVVDKLASFVESPYGPGFYIYGDVGVGKTFLTTAVTNELAMQGKKIAFVHIPSLASNLRNLISQRISLDSILYNLKTVDILVMDDIGAESVTNWFRDEILLSVLNYRMESNLSCFYTSNLNLEELENHYMYNNKREYNKLEAIRLLERIKMTSRPIILSGDNRRDLIRNIVLKDENN